MLFNGRSFFMKYATNNSNSTVFIPIFTMLFSTGLMSDAPYAAANSNVYMNMFFIIATLINGSMYCANSTNYIADDKILSIKYLLGVLNSSLVNFFIKQTSTNTNITAKVLSSIPIAVPPNDVQGLIATIVDYIILINSAQNNLSELVSNDTIASYFEKIIDGCVYELYFDGHMKEQEINIIDSALELIKPITHLSSDKEKADMILDVFMNIKKTFNYLIHSVSPFL